MENFEFANPINYVFGKGQITKLDELIGKKDKVLIITYKDDFIYKSGVIKQVTDALPGRTILEWAKIEANPEYTTVLEAVDIVKNEKVDFILAVGGGSVLDATKFTAIASYNNWDDPWTEVFDKALANATGAVKFGSVMTLPGTGSEYNNGFVISWREKGLKKDMFGPDWSYPRFSIVDPMTTLTLPQKQTANAIVDSFTHVLEQYVATKTGSDVQDYFSAGLLRTIYNNAQIVMKTPNDYEARANLSFAASMALNGFLRTRENSDLSVHFMGHQITALYGVDHGSSLLPIQIANYRILKELKRDMILHMGRYAFDIVDGSEDERVEETINFVEKFFAQTGLPTKFSDYPEIAADGKEKFVDKVMAKLHEVGLVPVGELHVPEDQAREILAMSY